MLRVDLADYIRLSQQEPALKSLVIGGYAVAAHGHTRATFDVDLIVRGADRGAWLDRLAGAGLNLVAQTSSFAQFSPTSGGEGLDLMFVNESTFDRMWQASEERDFAGVTARIPCLDHLLALKLHSLRYGLPHRTAKDAEDIEILVRRNKVNIRDPRYEQLFLKYGTREIYETFLRLMCES